MRVKRIFVAACAALMLAGCGIHVGVIGDSITYLAKDTIKTKLEANNYVVGLEAYPGADTRDAINMLNDQLSQDSAITHIAVNTGTNDIQRNIAAWQTDYNDLVTIMLAHHCGVLVTINHQVDTTGNGNGSVTSTQINTYLHTTVAAHSAALRLIEWDAAVTADPTLVDPNDTPRNVHPTAAGKQWLADHYNSTLGTCPA